MKKQTLFSIFLMLLLSAGYNNSFAKSRGYFELKVYHITSKTQETSIDSFLQYQYVPTMHGAHISNIGIFKPIANDTAADKKIYVFTPYNSLKQWESVKKETLEKFETAAGSGYVNAVYSNPSFVRMETILLRAFEKMPFSSVPSLTGPKSERVYELRSYESASEKIFRNKVQMFNQGGEVNIFSKLGFNAVFYSEVVFGARMPNLMYMTSFENMAARDEHWKSFGNDPAWKVLSAKPEYQNNVAHIDITFLRSTNYSDL